jgi:hypothetical protein
MTATKAKTTSNSGIRTRKTTLMVTEWEINPLVCDLIDRAQREYYRITACEVYGGPRIHCKIRPYSKCFRCGDVRVAASILVIAMKPKCRRCKAFHWRVLRVRTASGAGTKSVSRGGPRREGAERAREAQNGATLIELLKGISVSGANRHRGEHGDQPDAFWAANEHDGDRADARHSGKSQAERCRAAHVPRCHLSPAPREGATPLECWFRRRAPIEARAHARRRVNPVSPAGRSRAERLEPDEHVQRISTEATADDAPRGCARGALD